MKTLLIVLLTTIALSSTAQNSPRFSGGIAAGVSTGSIKVSNIKNAAIDVVKGNNIMGFEIGFFGRINFDPVFVKAMVLAAYKGGPADFYNLDGTIKRSKFNVGKIEVPLLIGLKLINFFRIEAGPVYNYIYHETHTVSDGIKVNPSGLGYRLGANIEFSYINLGVAYQGIRNKSDGNSTSTYTTPDELIFTLGIVLGGRQ